MSSPTIIAAAAGLYKLQKLFGPIPNIASKGCASFKILQQLMHIRKLGNSGGDNQTSEAFTDMTAIVDEGSGEGISDGGSKYQTISTRFDTLVM